MFLLFIAFSRSVSCEINARYFKALVRSPFPPDFNVERIRESRSVLSVRNKRPIMLNRAAELQDLNIEIGGAGG